MTKRFTTKNGVFYTDNLTGWEFQSYGEVVKLMNELSDENEQLKSKNRGLQSELQIFKEDATHSNLQINKLADENEQLKHRIAELQNELNNCEEDYVLEEYL